MRKRGRALTEDELRANVEVARAAVTVRASQLEDAHEIELALARQLDDALAILAGAEAALNKVSEYSTGGEHG